MPDSGTFSGRKILQGVALSFLLIPLMALAMSRIQPEKMGNATSIFNLMRNIGGSVDIAIMTTFLARRSQMHQNHLVAMRKQFNELHCRTKTCQKKLLKKSTI